MTEEQTVSIMAAMLVPYNRGNLREAVSQAMNVRHLVCALYERDRYLATDKQRAAGSDAT
jgi:hypothetical protein